MNSQQPYHQPATLEEVRTLWIGDLPYWADESYLHSWFAHTAEVTLFSFPPFFLLYWCCFYVYYEFLFEYVYLGISDFRLSREKNKSWGWLMSVPLNF